jgi:hypothetical protein
VTHGNTFRSKGEPRLWGYVSSWAKNRTNSEQSCRETGGGTAMELEWWARIGNAPTAFGRAPAMHRGNWLPADQPSLVMARELVRKLDLICHRRGFPTVPTALRCRDLSLW